MAEPDTIDIEVAYALVDRQVVIALETAADATLETAIRQSGILEQFDEIDLSINRVGVFGKLGKLTDSLHDGDRIEIYRPLIADPKQVRKERAAAGKAMKKGAGTGQ